MRVLAIAPHPDDETLGCGGTLLKHRMAGDQISWLIVTRADESQYDAEIMKRKEAEIKKVAATYGFAKVLRLNLPTIKIDTIPMGELMDQLREALAEAEPECVYLNHCGDVHSDHRVIFDAVMSVLKPFYSQTHGVRRLLSYEVLSSTDAALQNSRSAFTPNVYLDITETIDQKLDIMSLYASEAQSYPLPRAPETIRALARYRGGTIGVEYAEAFMLLREVGMK